MRALVTGAAGFLGSCLARELITRGYQVRGFSRRRHAALESLGVEWHAGDLRDPDSVARACVGQDLVFHTAAIAGIWGKWSDYWEVNTRGTERLLAAAQRSGVTRFIYSSSPSVTFDGSDQRGVDESAEYPQRWLCYYAQTKAWAEQAVLSANGLHGMATCALRPHLIWGPGDPHLVPRLLERARAGKLRQVGDGKNLIDVIYIDNAVDAHVLAAEALSDGSPVAGKAYFVSQGTPVNCWDWINELLQLAGIEPIRRRVSLSTAWWIGSLMESVYRGLQLSGEPRMTRFLAAQLGRSHYFDISRAHRDFGYEPRISLPEGMRRLVNSWRTG